MGGLKFRYCLLIFAFLLLVFLPCVEASNAPGVVLISPSDGNISGSGNMTFICNATDDENIFNISLYHNINGGFGIYDTKKIMELENDSNTTLMCRFDNSYICEDGDTGSYASTSFVSGKIKQGVLVDSSDTLTYPTANNVLFGQGTIEFWVKLGLDPGSQEYAYLFSTGESEQSEIRMYINYYDLCFIFYDADSYSKSACRDVSGWSGGEWHHVAAVWKIGGGGMVDIFLDGSNQSVYYSGEYYSTGSFGNYLYIGSNAAGADRSNSIFDEFRISDYPRTAAEINASYLKAISSYTQESANWTITNIPDGSYLWNCLVYDNESQSSWNDTNYTFNIDSFTPPTVNSVALSPDSANDIDPGVTLNFTANITDLSNVSTAILQYKYDAEWNNITMTNISQDLWNASVATVASERVYYYRIWSNDTTGNSNTSQTWSVNVTWDYTWTRSPSYFDAYGLVNSISNVGIITVNNTGDDTLVITLADDWPIVDVYYNTTEQFSIASGDVKDINVTAKYADFDSASNMTITISAEPSAPGKTASPTSLNTIATINSYSGGAYLDVNIVTYPTSVEQSTTGINFSATIKNIGNETAEDVWFNWTFPYGWTNTSGNLTMYIGNMSSQSATNTSSLVVSVNSSASSGISVVYVNASGAGNVSNYAYVNVAVLCSDTDGVCGSGCSSSNDADCPSVISGGGIIKRISGGGSIQKIYVHKYGIEIELPYRADVNRGETIVFHVNVSNSEKNTIVNNITLSLEGHPQTLVKINPESISNLIFGMTGEFDIEIIVPNYMKYGIYNLFLKARGNAEALNVTSNATPVEATGKMVLFIHSATENETKILFGNAEQCVQEMKASGFNADYVSNLLEQGKTALYDWDYDRVEEISEDIIYIKNKAFEVFDRLKKIEKGINEAILYGVDVPETQRMYNLSLSAFNRGDFERAAERAKDASVSYSLETGGKLIGAMFFHDYWGVMLIAGIAVVLIAFFVHRKREIVSIKNRLDSLKKEEGVIRGLIKDLQLKYFESKAVGKKEYKENIHDYEKRLVEIKKEQAGLVSKKAEMLGLRGVTENPEKEREHIKRLIKDIQRSYFESRSVSRDVYKQNISQLKAELADIEKNIEKKKGGNSKAYILLFLILFWGLVCGAPGVFAQHINNETAASEAIDMAELYIKEMQGLGYGITRANDTLNEAKLLFSQENYLGAETVARYVEGLKETAINADRMIDEVELKIYESEKKGLDVSPARELFENALDAFDVERFEDAEMLLKKASDKLDEIESLAIMERTIKESEKESVIYILQEYWYILVISAAGFFIAIIILYKVTESGRLKKRLVLLKKEKNAIENLIRKIQEEYFEKGIMPKNEYEIKMNRYKKRMNKIKKDISVLEQIPNG